MNELDRLGLRKNTVIILWGDHGYQLGEHGTWNKRTNWEVAARVPLMISVPGQMHAGEKTTALVELVDMYPTLAQLCHLEPPAGLEGQSFVPLLAQAGSAVEGSRFHDLLQTAAGNGHRLRPGDAHGPLSLRRMERAKIEKGGLRALR